MTEDVQAMLSEAFVGRSCTVIRREFDYILFFEGHRVFVVSTPWRIVADDRVVLSATDHGQKFGHPEPIDGAKKANCLLGGGKLISLRLHPLFADLTFLFENGASFEVFNGSSGYDAWQAEFPSEGSDRIVIGLGGGGTFASTQ